MQTIRDRLTDTRASLRLSEVKVSELELKIAQLNLKNALAIESLWKAQNETLKQMILDKQKQPQQTLQLIENVAQYEKQKTAK